MNDRIADLSDRIAAGLGSLSERVPLILQNPRAYPREAMLLAAVVALILVLLAILALVLIDVAGSVRRRKRLGLRRRRVQPFAVAVVVATLAVLALLLAVSPNTLFVSERCGGCHATQQAAVSWSQGTHASVACFGCHASGGLGGSLQASLRGVARLGMAAKRPMVGASQSVFDRRCQACHADDLSGTIQGAVVRMRHSDVLDAGFSCVTCHVGVGHAIDPAEPRLDRRPLMDYCLGCHDGTIASADCGICHDGRPSDTTGITPVGATPAPVKCVGCHSEQTDRSCVECHGLVLPHPEEFFGQHAGLSADDPALCASCHEGAAKSEACGCHGDVNLHGTYSEWFPKHGPQARIAWPGGCNCHKVDFCGICHETTPFK